MLNRTENEAEAASAAQTRVTPEELAAAITRLEARKDAGRRQAEGTVAIGEVVQQLGLDATPEEVLAEVQAQRIRPRQRRIGRLTRRNGWIAVGLVVGGLLSASAAVWFQPSDDRSGANSQFFGETAASLESKLLLQDSSGPTPVIRTLSETPEGHNAFCSAETVMYAADSRQFRFEQHPIPQGASDMTWPVVKHNGELYLRGWTPAALTKAAAKQDDRVAIYNSPNARGEDAHPTSITIRLSPEVFADGVAYRHWPTTTPPVFYVGHLRLDSHAYEKWQP